MAASRLIAALREVAMLARLGASLVTVLMVAGCVGSTSPPLPSQSAGSSTSASAPPTAPSLLPSTSLAASPSPFVALAWHSLGTIPATNIRGVVGYAKGYLAVGSTREVWSSPDGRTWKAVTLPFKATKDKYGNRLEADVWAVTTDGTRVLVVGGYAHAPCASAPPGGMDISGGGPGCPLAPLSWISADGVNWTSAYPGPQPADPPGYGQGSEFVAAWSVPTGGWDAALSYWAGESLMGRDLMHSADGIRWSALRPAPVPALTGLPQFPWTHTAVADETGRRVLWQQWSDYTTPFASGSGRPLATLATSTDGLAWNAIESFPGTGSQVLVGLPGAAGTSSPWILGGGSGITDDWTSLPTVWTSDDLTDWTRKVLPTAAGSLVRAVDAMVRAPLGYVAVGASWNGSAADHETWLSADGATWTLLSRSGVPGSDFGPRIVAEGPAGVIGIGVDPDDSEHACAVWRLR
jgi:hypothetical protein